MRIGRVQIGIRAHGRNKFHWFYHPLINEHEKGFVFFVWIGWHFVCAMPKKNNKLSR